MGQSSGYRRLRTLLVVVVGFSGSCLAQTHTLDRPTDPVILTGEALPMLLSLTPSNLVAFRYQGGWAQVPVQVDERVWADFGVIYGVGPTGVTSLVHADPGTYTGADTNAGFDTDDELVIMAKDAGDRAPANACLPAGTLTNSPVELLLTDTLTSGTGYVYLFRSDGSLDPAAGNDYVHYEFKLMAGTYPSNYNTMTGPNLEDSYASNAWYRTHFSDRWIRDELNIYTGGASGVNILDRHKNMFAPGNCGRTEDTFSNGEGAFIVNKAGPVRALRSYVGANSGPFTQRDHFLYERRQDIATYLRVHQISGITDLYDYSSGATGMVYYSSIDTNGVMIDGIPDSVATGTITWEAVTGTQGSLVTVPIVTTDIVPLTYTSYYSDDSSPPVIQCTGDDFEYGTSGIWINQQIPNTDPFLGATNHLIAARVDYYDAPGLTVAKAEQLSIQAVTPLQATVTHFPGDADCDGMADEWESTYFGSLDRDGTLDTDKDRALDGAEYVAGSNPTNNASAPTLAAALVAGQPVVSFTALKADGPGYTGLGRFYALERRADLLSGDWQEVPGYTNIPGVDQVVGYPVPPDTGIGLFRTRIELR